MGGGFQITQTIDISRALKLTDTVLRQLPFATSRALNRTAKLVQSAEVFEMRRVFDRPTPWTVNSVFIKPATKESLVARVWLKDWAPNGTPASKYLLPEIEGGPRSLKRSERALELKRLLPDGMYLTPGKAVQLDAYGNIPASLMTSILSKLQAFGEQGYLANQTIRSRRAAANKREYFVGRPGGGRLPLGVWQRTASGVRPILIAVSPPRYRERYDFFGVANEIVRSRFAAIFEEELASAIRSAR